jgi:hypothetical protein
MSKLGIIEAQDLMDAFVDAVVDECKTAKTVDDYFRWDTHDETWQLRSRTEMWGSYWTIRKISHGLKYAESRELETKMDAFVHQYAATLAYTKLFNEDEEN